MTEKSRLIALEGGEGTGKSTQIRLLAEYLVQMKREVVTTREPGGTAGGQGLRHLLLSESDAKWHPAAETLLMVADRVQHIDQVIAPALAAGKTVLTDRFVFSTLAYQGAGRGVAESAIRTLHRDFCGDLWPDLTIVLDLDPRIGIARSRKRLSAAGSDEARFENLDLDFHQRVRQRFLAAASETHAVIIDAAQSVDDVQQAIRCAVEAFG